MDKISLKWFYTTVILLLEQLCTSLAVQEINNNNNRDVEKLQLATFDKSHAVTRKRQPSPAVYENERR